MRLATVAKVTRSLCLGLAIIACATQRHADAGSNTANAYGDNSVAVAGDKNIINNGRNNNVITDKGSTNNGVINNGVTNNGLMNNQVHNYMRNDDKKRSGDTNAGATSGAEAHTYPNAHAHVYSDSKNGHADADAVDEDDEDDADGADGAGLDAGRGGDINKYTGVPNNVYNMLDRAMSDFRNDSDKK